MTKAVHTWISILCLAGCALPPRATISSLGPAQEEEIIFESICSFLREKPTANEIWYLQGVPGLVSRVAAEFPTKVIRPYNQRFARDTKSTNLVLGAEIVQVKPIDPSHIEGSGFPADNIDALVELWLRHGERGSYTVSFWVFLHREGSKWRVLGKRVGAVE
jgi:hypothetical protein